MIRLLVPLLLSAVSLIAASPKPNVVLFLVDDMGWKDCGAYGSAYYETPRIDAFAKTGMKFTSAYAQPLCSPTRASLLSGQYSARHGVTSASGHQLPQPEGFAFLPETAPPNQPMLTPASKNYLDPKHYTLAETLKEAGYRTAHIGKWHLGLTQPHWPEQQGFDVTFHCHPDPGPPGEYFSPYGVMAEGTPNGKTRVGNITDGPEGEYIVDRQAAEAEKFIAANKDKPFFLNLWCYGVHGPWGHKEEYTKYFAQKAAAGGQGNPIMASMLKSVDDCFGRILDALEKQGVADNTIIIFNSDNGGNTHSNTAEDGKRKKKGGESPLQADWRRWAGVQPPTNNTPLRDGKGTLYEGGTRVPLIWRWAGKIPAGTENAGVVAHIDVYPTLMDLLGMKVPEQQKVDGVSYAKALTDGAAVERAAFFNYFPHGSVGRGGVTVRAGDFKLIRWFTPTMDDPLRYELYDLNKDLGETKNLAAAIPQKVKELDALIDGFLKDTGATYPRPNPAYKGSPKAAARGERPWVPKGCTMTEENGRLAVKGESRRPFLGMTGLDLSGPVTLSLSVTSAGGPAKVQWRTTEQEAFPAEGQVVEFTLPEGADAKADVKLPVQGSLAHLRLYVPAAEAPVSLDWAELKPSQGEVKRWDFNGKSD